MRAKNVRLRATKATRARFPTFHDRDAEHARFNWKTKYGGMEVSEAKRLKTLEEENVKWETPR